MVMISGVFVRLKYMSLSNPTWGRNCGFLGKADIMVAPEPNRQNGEVGPLAEHSLWGHGFAGADMRC